MTNDHNDTENNNTDVADTDVAAANELSTPSAPVKRRARGAQGFSLLEIMVVLAIIGLIVGGIGVVAFNQFGKAQKKTAKQRVSQVAQASIQFMLDNENQCPKGIDDLISQKYLQKGFKDPWGQEFTLRCPGTNDPSSVDVSSNGADKQAGNEDDINSWD